MARRSSNGRAGERGDNQTANVGIPLAEYRARRARVLKELGGSVGLVLAGDGALPLHGRWEPDPNFVYLTGVRNEPGAAVLFDATHENPARRCTLFLKPRDPEMEVWDGYRHALGEELRGTLGFDTVLRTPALPRMLTAALRRSKRAAALHPFAAFTGGVSEDLATLRKAGERMVGVALEDRTEILPALRGIKSAAELALMRRAAECTRAGFAAAVDLIRPGVTERQVQMALEHAFSAGGAEGTAYNCIVGSGINSTVLHYSANTETMQAGDVVCIDAGASFAGYACDVTRTYPVSGRFSSPQREVYELVLAAQQAALDAVKPGVYLHEVDEAARAVFRKAGLLDAYAHGIGHHLGLVVHDATPDGPLQAGMVVTIEPGLYIPATKIGVRIEDDVLVGRRGNEILTAAIPKQTEDIERLMGGR